MQDLQGRFITSDASIAPSRANPCARALRPAARTAVCRSRRLAKGARPRCSHATRRSRRCCIHGNRRLASFAQALLLSPVRTTRRIRPAECRLPGKTALRVGDTPGRRQSAAVRRTTPNCARSSPTLPLPPRCASEGRRCSAHLRAVADRARSASAGASPRRRRPGSPAYAWRSRRTRVECLLDDDRGRKVGGGTVWEHDVAFDDVCPWGQRVREVHEAVGDGQPIPF
jgi:hypothetical protein